MTVTVTVTVTTLRTHRTHSVKVIVEEIMLTEPIHWSPEGYLTRRVLCVLCVVVYFPQLRALAKGIIVCLLCALCVV
jgi:hypothetical protein